MPFPGRVDWAGRSGFWASGGGRLVTEVVGGFSLPQPPSVQAGHSLLLWPGCGYIYAVRPGVCISPKLPAVDVANYPDKRPIYRFGCLRWESSSPITIDPGNFRP